MGQITSSSGEQQNLTLHTSEWPFLICSSSMLHKGSYYEDCENVLYIVDENSLSMLHYLKPHTTKTV